MDYPLVMKANIRPEHEIQTRNAGLYHIFARKVLVNPMDPKHPVIRPKLLVFRPVDYKKYFQCSEVENIEYLKTMNYEGAELVHDPTRNDKETIKLLAQIWNEDQKAAKEALQSVLLRKSKSQAYN